MEGLLYSLDDLLESLLCVCRSEGSLLVCSFELAVN
jgi:hypothetical protein